MAYSSNPGSGMTFRTLIAFLALSFGLTWGIFALLISFPGEVERTFGKLSGTNPLFILAVYAPALAAALLVGKHYGVKGLASYLRRLTLWRMSGWWWLVLLLAAPAM